jgi:hypothetical protein
MEFQTGSGKIAVTETALIIKKPFNPEQSIARSAISSIQQQVTVPSFTGKSGLVKLIIRLNNGQVVELPRIQTDIAQQIRQLLGI